jgi:hypothetical protein
MSSKLLTDEELEYISKNSGIDVDVIKAWHKDFLQTCPKGKMASCITTVLDSKSTFIFLG